MRLNSWLCDQSINLNKFEIKAVEKIKNLGVIFDKTRNMDHQVKSMCKKTFYNIQKYITHQEESE
jgi:phosphoribosylformylglycinamidine (FGAM) synthase PurS component